MISIKQVTNLRWKVRLQWVVHQSVNVNLIRTSFDEKPGMRARCDLRSARSYLIIPASPRFARNELHHWSLEGKRNSAQIRTILVEKVAKQQGGLPPEMRCN